MMQTFRGKTILYFTEIIFLWVFIFSFIGCGRIDDLNNEKTVKGQGIEYEDEILDFYSTKDPYGEFSNFALYAIFIDGEWWKTSEHYYQANKYIDPELVKWVQSADTPMEAALRGRSSLHSKRSDWNEVKDLVMEKAVRVKFASYPELQKLLLSTGQKKIYEHTKNDCYWGDCGDRTGKNKLGILLEKLRSEIIEFGEVSLFNERI